MRDIIALACNDCKRRNYSTTKNRKKSSERIELSKDNVDYDNQAHIPLW